MNRKWKSHPCSNAQNDCISIVMQTSALTFAVIWNRTYGNNYYGPIQTHIHERRIWSRNTEKPKLIIEKYFCIVSILDWGVPCSVFNPARRSWRISYFPLPLRNFAFSPDRIVWYNRMFVTSPVYRYVLDFKLFNFLEYFFFQTAAKYPLLCCVLTVCK